jgi:hypothetical protein
MFYATKAFFFGSGNQLPIPEQSGRGIVVVARDTQNVHDSLLPCPTHIMNFGRAANPGMGRILDAKRIPKKADDQAERQQHSHVDKCEKQPRLKISDFPRYAFPSVPSCLQVL